MAFFANASNVNIFGGSFVNNEVRGNLTVDDHSRHATNLNSNNRSTSNMTNSHNNNSRRTYGSDEEIPSMPSTRYAEEDRPRPPPPQRSQRPGPKYSPPETGGTATNLDSFNVENTKVNNVFNDNSRHYYQGGTPSDNRRHYKPSGPDQDGEGLPSTNGPYGSGQFKAPMQVPVSLQQMGVGCPPGPHMSVNGANIQQMDPFMGQSFEKWMESTMAQTKSMVAGMTRSGGNSGYDPRAAYPSSSRNAEGSDSMNTEMANLSLNDLQSQTPTQPTSLSSDRQIGLKRTDQMGSSNTSMGPYNNAVQQGSHYNPSRMNEPDILNPETRPYGNNPNRPPPPASTSPFNLPPLFSEGLISNIYYGNPNKADHSVHHMNTNSFNQHDKTIQDSFNDNSLFDSTGKHSATESNKKRGFRDPDVSIPTRKERNSGVRTSESLDPSSNGMDEDLSSDETNEQIPTAAESTVDSSGKKKKSKKWPLFGRK